MLHAVCSFIFLIRIVLVYAKLMLSLSQNLVLWYWYLTRLIILLLELAVGKPQAILPEETDTSLEDTEEGKMSDITQRTKIPTPEPLSSNSMITCKIVSICFAFILPLCLKKGVGYFTFNSHSTNVLNCFSG